MEWSRVGSRVRSRVGCRVGVGVGVEWTLRACMLVFVSQLCACLYPDIWIRLPRHKWPKSWSDIEDPMVPLERSLYGHPLAGLLWLLGLGWEKYRTGNVFLFTKKGIVLIGIRG